MRRALILAWAEVLHVVRDRATLAQVLLIPFIQLLVLANAATFEIRDTPLYVVDQDHTSASRGLITRFAASGDFGIVGASPSPELANERLLSGDVTMVLTIPHDFERDLVRNHAATVQLVVNAEKGMAAGIVQFYATRILTRYATELQPELGRGAAPSAGGEAAPRRGAPALDVRTRAWYNPTLDYKHYMVPGILVALVTLIGTLLTAQNIAREKELGTLEQLNVTPITRGQFIAGKLLPFWVLGMFELGAGLVLGRFVFGVPVVGSVALLFAVSAVYLVAALGVGLWISTIVETQQQAMFVTFFIMMVYLLMSGLFTPIDSMPRWVQIVAELNPVRHFVAISRAVLVKGATLREIEQPFSVLAIFAVAVFGLAVRQYSKRAA
ncbi:MAG TPA: ABC transporter permease [Gemmatimonadaceae bacterium]|jgi:ABC-2 type transport system permease protein|nr:ABC transporter permease [Gemmatimonadaceae bacterium]